MDSREEAVERARKTWEGICAQFYGVAHPLGFFDEAGPDEAAPVEAAKPAEEVPVSVVYPKPPEWKRAFETFTFHEPEPKK